MAGVGMEIPPSPWSPLLIPHTPETRVAGSAVRRVRAAGGDAVAIAVRLMAQVRAAADHAHRTDLRAAWILEHARRMIPTEPVRAPLPGVAGHVVEAEAVRRERVDRCGAVVAVVERVV